MSKKKNKNKKSSTASCGHKRTLIFNNLSDTANNIQRDWNGIFLYFLTILGNQLLSSSVKPAQWDATFAVASL